MSWLKRYLLAVIVLCSLRAEAQTGFDGFAYRGTLADLVENYQSLMPFNLRATFYETGTPGNIYWQETHILQTDSFGLYSAQIGTGTSTGLGSYGTFAAVEFNTLNVSLLLEADVAGTGFEEVLDGRLWAVPYTFHSRTTGELQTLNTDFNDVDSTGVQTNDVLIWNGSQWIPGNQNQVVTANYAYNAGTATYVDTAQFGYLPASMSQDTVPYAFLIDTANHAHVAGTADSVDTATWVNQATYALDVYTWRLPGNLVNSGDVFGSSNNMPVIFRSNNVEGMRLSADGKWHIGVTDSIPTLYQLSDEGALITGTYNNGSWTSPGNGQAIMFSPDKASFAGGEAIDTLWNDQNSNDYSFVYGRHSWSRGDHSQAFGDSCFVADEVHPYGLAPGRYSTAIGKNTQANGAYSFAAGLRCKAGTTRSVAMGKDCITPGGYAAVALGSNVNADGIFEPAFALGSNVWASGKFSTAFGHNVSLLQRRGGFYYGDYSPNDTLYGLLSYRFTVRASGGTIFYSDMNATAGVYLPASAGAWNTVSDRHKKANFEVLDEESLLDDIRSLPIYSWEYKSQPGVNHIGPMAQDFYNRFAYSTSDTTITSSDMDGVIFGGIKAVNNQLNTTEEKSDQIESSIEAPEYNSLHDRLDALEEKLNALKEEK